MMKGFFLQCRRGSTILRNLTSLFTHRQDSKLILFPTSLLHSSSSSCDSRSSLHNYYLRKRRRWPHSPYKTYWHITFAHQQAMQKLKQSVKTSKTHILTALMDSFAMYECDPSPNAYHFVIKVLFKNPTNWDQIPEVLDHIQKVPNFETPEYILIDLIKFYGDCNMIQDAVKLFYRIPLFRCNPSVDSLKALLLVLCEKRCLEIVPEVLIKGQTMNIRIDETCFGVLIKVLCRIGKVNFAVEMLNCMVNDELDLDGRICSYVLKCMCEQKERNGTEIMCFFEHLRKLGFSPNRGDWYNVILFLVNKENSCEAMKALTQMKKARIHPDIVCYNLILNRLILEEHYVKADELFDEMLVLGLVPNIFTYNSFINGLCQQNKVEEGIKILESMDELGCRPDLVTYNTILKALIRDRRMDLAREIIIKMEIKGMQLNFETCDLIVSGLLSNSEVEVGSDCDFLKETINRVSVYDSFDEFFDNILCRLCQRGMHQTAFELVRKIGDKNIAPGVRSWEALLQGPGFIHSSEDITPMIE